MAVIAELRQSKDARIPPGSLSSATPHVSLWPFPFFCPLLILEYVNNLVFHRTKQKSPCDWSVSPALLPSRTTSLAVLRLQETAKRATLSLSRPVLVVLGASCNVPWGSGPTDGVHTTSSE